MFRTIIILFSALLVTSATAADGHSGGSVMDLFPKAVNFALVFGFMLWKIKKPVSEMFTKNSRDVASLFKVADQKDKEAAAKLATYEQKLASLETEKNKIVEAAHGDAAAFEQKIIGETAATLEKMKRDNAAKIQAEQNSLTQKMGADLIEEVIAKTKSTVKSSGDNQARVTKNLMAKLS